MLLSRSRPMFGQFAAIAVAVAGAAAPQVAQASCGVVADKMAEIVNTTPSGDTLVLAHRGLWGSYAGIPSLPENSRGSLSAADTACVDGVELDVKVTQDGVPILMHDFNLGRTTTIWQLERRNKFDPMTGLGHNPAVSTRNWSTIARLFLLTPDRSTDTAYHPPRIDDLFDYHKRNGLTVPMVFDTKTADAVRAISIIAGNKFAVPRGFVAVKVNATLFPTPQAFLANALNITAIPVYTTNMVAKIDVAQSRHDWQGYVKTIEINVKQENGLLQGQMDSARSDGQQRVGVFQAIPDGPVSGQFYKASGVCCYRLSDIFYSGPEGRDTADNRGDMAYLIRQGFGLITTDDPRTAMRVLGQNGRRRAHIHGDEPDAATITDVGEDSTLDAPPLLSSDDSGTVASDDPGVDPGDEGGPTAAPLTTRRD